MDCIPNGNVGLVITMPHRTEDQQDISVVFNVRARLLSATKKQLVVT